ncbi:MAG: 2-phospho-L-lactate guanylyltransferase [Halomonas sp.]|nr:2-phospho-L-lactate guanylyltransferase [Halomonas sp.]
MSLWALVPLKTLGQGKTRLMPELPALGRQRLVETMLDRVMGALAGSERVEHIAIVGCDPDQCPPDVLHLQDVGHGLNPALTMASQQLHAAGADELLVMHADLPLVRSEEIDAFILAGRRRGLALASDRHGQGTNAIFLSQPGTFPFRFGRHSLMRHMAAAEASGLRPALSQAPGLLFDVDTAQDLSMLASMQMTVGASISTTCRSLSHG